MPDTPLVDPPCDPLRHLQPTVLATALFRRQQQRAAAAHAAQRRAVRAAQLAETE